MYQQRKEWTSPDAADIRIVHPFIRRIYGQSPRREGAGITHVLMPAVDTDRR